MIAAQTFALAGMVLGALLLGGCQSAPPHATSTSGSAATVGDWTVTQGGYVRVDAGARN